MDKKEGFCSSEEGRDQEEAGAAHDDIQNWRKNATRKQVVIVGGGVSGLAALKTFSEQGFSDVILLEAQPRLGGRICTFREGSVILEDGAQWIHGGSKNPVNLIAQTMKALGHDVSVTEATADVRVVHSDGRAANKENQRLAKRVDDLLEDGMISAPLTRYYGDAYGKYYTDRFCREISRGKEDPSFSAWLHFIEQYVASDEGADDWMNISARDADRYVDYGADFTWSSGFDALLKHLTSSVPDNCILLETPVRRIIWELQSETGVLVVTEKGGSYLADNVLMTTSVGYLKRNHDRLFLPSLPSGLQTALQGVSLGTCNKVIIGWPNFWWKGSRNIEIRILWTDIDLPEDMKWLHGVVDIIRADKKSPVLMAFVTGRYSLQMEQLPELQVKDHFLFLLRRIFQDTKIPDPTIFRRTMWNSNPWTVGSYGSFVTLEGDRAGLHSRAPFRKSLKNKWHQSTVHWAGEHTHDTRYGTVDGALQSGVREAKKILNQCCHVQS